MWVWGVGVGMGVGVLVWCAWSTGQRCIRPPAPRSASLRPPPPPPPPVPTDAVTKEWLKRALDPVFGFPGLVRFSWQTTDTILQASGVPVVWEGEEGAPGGKPSITAFFGAGGGGSGAGAGPGKANPVLKRLRLSRPAELV